LLHRSRDLTRWIFSACSLDALQDRQAKENERSDCNPMRRDMKNHGSKDQSPNQDEETNYVNRK